VITGYLVPFADRQVPVCKGCADDLGWFPLDHYKGTVQIVDDLIHGLKNRADHECSKCSKLFRGGGKSWPSR